ncbi:MAG: NAD(P)-dependent oxidoreductase, partial [Bacteroidetes bacterium]|nr:NAD(P)-dependent oxidoreductase [Bacteroidota bacterium]
MKVLITGATGFIGSHVADLLLERGYDVRALARSTSNLQWLKGKKVELVDGSISNMQSLEKAMKDVEMVFHVAGLTAARKAEEFMIGNRDGTRNMLEAAYKFAPNLQRFLHVSSLTAVRPSDSPDKPVDESTPSAPITSYGISKKAAEDVVNSFANKLPITIVRPPAVYGQRETAILDFFKTVNKGFVPYIGFDKKQVSLIHGLDLSRGIIEAAESSNTIGKTYFVSSEEFYTWEQIGSVT